jgi:acetylglutamate kinase
MRDVRLLKEALPYLRRHRRRSMVIKLGGEIAADAEALDSLAQDISLLTHVNVRVVLVHGGGPQATTLSRRLGLEPRLVQGRRVTDEDTLSVAKMVFAGQINVDILSALRRHGVRGVGLSGLDGDILSATRRPPTEMKDEGTGEIEMVDFGHVGDVTDVDPDLLKLLVGSGYVPVVSSLAGDSDGNTLNVNADTVASVLARSLGASKLITLTSVPGLLRDAANPESLVSHLTVAEARELMASGAVVGGMVPKLTTMIEALEGGVEAAVILSGVEESALLLELFTVDGAGTLIEKESSGRRPKGAKA